MRAEQEKDKNLTKEPKVQHRDDGLFQEMLIIIGHLCLGPSLLVVNSLPEADECTQTERVLFRETSVLRHTPVYI